jgi:NAD(P) transhydrogenase subunit beta
VRGLGWLSIILIALGAVVGYQLATRVQMTQMPELVAIMHSLVGLAAVFVGFNADIMINSVQSLLIPAVDGRCAEGVSYIACAQAAGSTVLDDLSSFGSLVAKKTPVEITILMVELSLGIWIGAVTFTGSVVAYGKLSGNSSLLPFKIDTAAKQLPGGHMLNAAAAGLSVLMLILYLAGAGSWTLVVLTLLALFIGYHLIMGIGGADMPVVVSMLNSYSGWGGGGHRLLAVQRPADRGRRAGGLVRCHLVLHHVQGHEPLVHLGDPRRLRRCLKPRWTACWA